MRLKMRALGLERNRKDFINVINVYEANREVSNIRAPDGVQFVRQ